MQRRFALPPPCTRGPPPPEQRPRCYSPPPPSWAPAMARPAHSRQAPKVTSRPASQRVGARPAPSCWAGGGISSNRRNGAGRGGSGCARRAASPHTRIARTKSLATAPRNSLLLQSKPPADPRIADRTRSASPERSPNASTSLVTRSPDLGERHAHASRTARLQTWRRNGNDRTGVLCCGYTTHELLRVNGGEGPRRPLQAGKQKWRGASEPAMEAASSLRQLTSPP